MSGVDRIAAERQRQIEEEGFDAAHDAKYTRALMDAAIAYTTAARYAAAGLPVHSSSPDWPWDEEWWKPSLDPIRNLEKAGALIAAEIDRLEAAGERSDNG